MYFKLYKLIHSSITVAFSLKNKNKIFKKPLVGIRILETNFMKDEYLKASVFDWPYFHRFFFNSDTYSVRFFFISTLLLASKL